MDRLEKLISEHSLRNHDVICEQCLLCKEIESLRQQAKTLEDKIGEWRNECMNLRQQLAQAKKALQEIRDKIDAEGPAAAITFLLALKDMIDKALTKE